MSTQFNILCKEATLYEAWNIVKSKGSAGGVDGVSIETFNQDKMEQIIQRQAKLLAKVYDGSATIKPYVAKW